MCQELFIYHSRDKTSSSKTPNDSNSMSQWWCVPFFLHLNLETMVQDWSRVQKGCRTKQKNSMTSRVRKKGDPATNNGTSQTGDTKEGRTLSRGDRRNRDETKDPNQGPEQSS